MTRAFSHLLVHLSAKLCTVACMHAIPELNTPSVFIKNRQQVEGIIRQLVAGGPEKLQVIADFDHTLSKHSHEGQIIATCFGILENSSAMPQIYKDQVTQLKEIYYPIEFCHEMTNQEKYPYMVEWWTKAQSIFVQCELYKETITEMVAQTKCVLRDGSERLLYKLYKHGVPLLVFSAGIGDILEEVMRQKSTMHDNVKVVSNYMEYNGNGKVIGFKGNLIHTFSKNESAIENSDYFEKLSHRHNIILMGDSIGDCHMADGCPSPEATLKIGFLNHGVDRLLSKYQDLYDIVLVQDGTMDVPTAIINRIF
ncbi:PREDICTED: cytosolic 5'-nucleotidase 3-like isoform X2 [Priapulus caudatus]|uniref:5'-nucleotidase n=1 Tax=Priapulus caudatus TaxID=37621 RepID=A0ABM1DP07_PRICU|nr:PREDICTED: cytosolic 5'-nucleotidase 3-like isoform X2 [Priapulus caudatus]